MTDMQSKILGAVEKVATEHGVEAVKKSRYANSGALYVQPVDGFDHFLTVFYDFQDGYFTLHLVGEAVEQVKDDVAKQRVDDDARYPTLRYNAPGDMSGASCPREARFGSSLWFPGTYDNGAEITYVLGVIGNIIEKGK